jgi:hypothetical protein
MTQAQLERGIHTLYNSDTVRDELTDDEARVLLQWGEAQVARLAAKDFADVAFDVLVDHLRQVMIAVNAFVGRRVGASMEDQRYLLGDIMALAEPLNYRVNRAELNLFLWSEASTDDPTLMERLVSALHPFEPAPPRDDLF